MDSIDQRLRRIIARSGKNLRSIADSAEVPYMSLWSWFTGRQTKLDFVQAEKIHRALTGRGFGK
jgi:hypothetical protein